MNRRHLRLALTLLVALAVAASFERAVASNPIRWTIIPRITIIGASGDPRIEAARQAVEFWNRTFAELATPFRLGRIAIVAGSVPDEDIKSLGDQVVRNTQPTPLPASLQRFPGDILIVLSDANFISYTAHGSGRVVIAIKNGHAPPLTLPNVVPNVIAHELGHAVGLEHDQDPALLMCGRPAACRPDAFESESPRMFPLSNDDRRRLLELYPRSWVAQQP